MSDCARKHTKQIHASCSLLHDRGDKQVQKTQHCNAEKVVPTSLPSSCWPLQYWLWCWTGARLDERWAKSASHAFRDGEGCLRQN